MRQSEQQNDVRRIANMKLRVKTPAINLPRTSCSGPRSPLTFEDPVSIDELLQSRLGTTSPPLIRDDSTNGSGY